MLTDRYTLALVHSPTVDIPITYYFIDMHTPISLRHGLGLQLYIEVCC